MYKISHKRELFKQWFHFSDDRHYMLFLPLLSIWPSHHLHHLERTLQQRSPLSFLSHAFKKQPKFPFKPWTIVHGGQKIGSAQKIHVNRDWCEMHANQFWWAWSLRFRSYDYFLFAFKNGQNFPLDHGL